MTSIAALSEATELAPTTAATSLAKLAEIGVVKEITGAKYGRLFAYDGYLKILAPHECISRRQRKRTRKLCASSPVNQLG